MRDNTLTLLVIIILMLNTTSFAQSNQHPTVAEEIVVKLFRDLETGDIISADNLFIRIPVMEKNRDVWLNLLKKISNKTNEEHLVTDVVFGCGKELNETALVAINKSMKLGKPTQDTGYVILIKEHAKWLLLPDFLLRSLREEVLITISEKQKEERNTLTNWINQKELFEIDQLSGELKLRECL